MPLMMQSGLRYASNASTSDAVDATRPWPPQNGIEWMAIVARVPASTVASEIAAALTVLHQRQAASRLDPVNAESQQQTAEQRVVLDPAAEGISNLREELGRPLIALLGMVSVLLVIACGNLASLLLSRANARDREMAIRLSIGAGRSRVIRQLLAETLLLATLGGALGLLIAAWGRDLLLTLFAGNAVIDLDSAFDWRVLSFAAGLTLITGIAAGVGPALRGTRVSLAEAMKAHARSVGAAGTRGALVGKVLVAAQIAFCLLLLVLAALFTRSMQSLLEIDVGYDRDALLVARLDVRSLGHSPSERQGLYQRVLMHVKAMPGVASASVSLNGPMGTSRRTSSLTVEGYMPRRDKRLQTHEDIVTDAYFDTVGLTIVEGRGFRSEDRRPGARATVINQSMAKRFFPGGSAIGKRWTYGNPIDGDARVIRRRRRGREVSRCARHAAEHGLPAVRGHARRRAEQPRDPHERSARATRHDAQESAQRGGAVAARL
ncbi:MAG: FtsX-like permease family protein [Acidobacteria bacterium]|nr:FtsX-like permease family protein [Acidobacteriota bacterium]